jgi:hypothetical protein
VGGCSLLGTQLTAPPGTLGCIFVVPFKAGIIDRLLGCRIAENEEIHGIDRTGRSRDSADTSGGAFAGVGHWVQQRDQEETL